MIDEEDQPEEENEEQEDASEDGGDAEGGDGDAEDDEEEGLDNNIVMIAGGIVVLLLVVGGGLYFTGMLDSLLGKEEACVETVDDHGNVIPCEEEHAEDDHGGGGGHGGGHGEEGATNFLEIPPMIVNLNSEDGTPRYLRLTVQLEMYKSGDVAGIEAVMPRVIDQFQTYLRQLRVKDLRGSSGIYRLQTELLWRVNQAADPIKVKDVLFQEILIQ